MEGQRMNHWKRLAPGLLWMAGLPLLSQTHSVPSTAAASSTGQQSRSATAHAAHPTDGERVFEQNCSRCHNAPQGFSPRISGTVVRHMRVRASLSKEDEQALLRFLNP
jgi:cytochrome c5